MNKIYNTLKIFRAINKRVNKSTIDKNTYVLNIDYTGQQASDIIKKMLLDDKPIMISRIGSIELNTVVRYIDINNASQYSGIYNIIQYIKGNSPQYWWGEQGILMRDLAGFFPLNDKYLDRFSIQMLNDFQNIDIIGSWLKNEMFVNKYFHKSLIKVKLEDLEPYYHKNPWSEALQDKNILVIHPFDYSIEKQYKIRHALFDDQRILPRFKLQTLKAVQTIGNNTTKFKTWFDALESMCDEISLINFDIAIIGAGAYGLPIASYVKKIGKKSIHLGGATQILFGIRCKRWDDRHFFQNLYNDHWIRPSNNEVPKKYKKVEGGCYW